MKTYSLKARVCKAIALFYFAVGMLVIGTVAHYNLQGVVGAGCFVAGLLCMIGLYGFTGLAERLEAQHALEVRSARDAQWASEAEAQARLYERRSQAYYHLVGCGVSHELANLLAENDVYTLGEALEIEQQYADRNSVYSAELAQMLTNAWVGGLSRAEYAQAMAEEEPQEESDEELAAAEESFLNRAANYPFTEDYPF